MLTNDGDLILGGLELPEGDIDGDTTLTLGLQLVQHPGVLEGTLAKLGGFLLELLDGTLVDTTALVDQVTLRDFVSTKPAIYICLEDEVAYQWWSTCRNRRGR